MHFQFCKNMHQQMSMTNETAVDACYLNISQASRAILGFALMSVATLGTVGNSVLSYYVIRHTEMQSLINILLATMAISDTLISCLCTTLDFLAVVKKSWIFGDFMCHAHSFMVSVLVVQNVTVLVMISLDRYSILVHKRDSFRRCRPAALLSGCIIFSALVSSPPLFHNGRLIFANKYCKQICEENRDDYVYSLLYSGLLFVLPCGLLLLAYVHIIVTIRKTKRKVRPAFQQRISVNSVQKSLRINLKFKQKTFSTILWLYAAAVVCKFPLAISIFFQSLTTYAVCPVAHWIMLLLYVNSAINPLIYALKITEYWMMVTGKFSNVKNQVKIFRRMSRLRSQPQNIYMVTTVPRTSVI